VLTELAEDWVVFEIFLRRHARVLGECVAKQQNIKLPGDCSASVVVLTCLSPLPNSRLMIAHDNSGPRCLKCVVGIVDFHPHLANKKSDPLEGSGHGPLAQTTQAQRPEYYGSEAAVGGAHNDTEDEAECTGEEAGVLGDLGGGHEGGHEEERQGEGGVGDEEVGGDI
jgi:hypothetical protein